LNRDGQRRSAYQLLSYPHVDFAMIGKIWPEANAIDRRIAEQIETDAKYAVYLARQAEDVESFRRDEALPLPDVMDYTAIAGLSIELRQKLSAVRPRTVGQADRIDGMTPAALALVALHARRAG
jgi:tRNA uridine 5-carboxymethylaminomethyl modification enzyme